MRTLYLLISIIIGLNLTSCSSVQNPPVQHPPLAKSTEPAKNKNPLAVGFYSNSKEITHPYKVLGTRSVSKFNTAGIKRQEANIRDAMRAIAASMGGDAVIDVSTDNKNVTGTIVSFEKNVSKNSNV